MDPADLVDVVSYGLTHDAEGALDRLLSAEGRTDESMQAAAAFLRVLSCRFDEALDTALVLTTCHVPPSPLGKAAADLAVAVCAGAVTTEPGCRGGGAGG